MLLRLLPLQKLLMTNDQGGRRQEVPYKFPVP
jgi:hypothetical protein